MFFSPPPAARRHLVRRRRRRKSNGILIDAFEIIQGNRRQRRPPRRTSTKRANGFREAFGGRFVPVGECDDDEEMKAEVTIVLDQPRWTAEDDEQMAKFLSFSKSSSSTVSSVFAPRFSRFRGGGKQQQQQQQQQHAVKEEIEKRFSAASDGGELARRKLARRSRAVLELRRRKRGL